MMKMMKGCERDSLTGNNQKRGKKKDEILKDTTNS